jgi:hypothetical protein
MTSPPVPRSAAFVAVAALLLTMVALSTSSPVTAAAANTTTSTSTSAATSTAAGSAKAGRQCLPRPAKKSLVVRGRVSCKHVKSFLDSARELALATENNGYKKFTIKGFLCKLRDQDHRRFRCHDIDGKPKRFFSWADKTN